MSKDFGLFASLRIQAGHCTLLPLHLQQMAASAQALEFRLDLQALEQAIYEQAAQHVQDRPARLRVMVSAEGTWIFEPLEVLVPDADQLQAMLWPEPTNSANPLLRHKTTHRPVYDRAVRVAHGVGFIDAIFQNERGLVTEGAVHSVFVRHGKEWRTPTLSAGVQPGIYRRHVLETIPNTREEDFGLEELLSAEEVWLTNAVRGIRKVRVQPALKP